MNEDIAACDTPCHLIQAAAAHALTPGTSTFHMPAACSQMLLLLRSQKPRTRQSGKQDAQQLHIQAQSSSIQIHSAWLSGSAYRARRGRI
jgi:hypothetical protein